MDWRRRALMAVVLVALATCEGAPVANVSVSIGYRPGEELSGGNDVPVIVIGNPFPVPQPEFTANAIDAMQGWAFGPAHFVPAVDPNVVYRVMLMFNPSSNVIGETLCTRPPTAQATFGAPPAPQAPLSAALCRGDSYLTYAYGSVPTGDGPTSETFRRGLGQFIRTLFPSRNPQRNFDRCRFGIC
jgi:hypothetical protein